MNFSIRRVKIIVTVPKESLVVVRDAVCNAGAGVIGNYSYCSTSINCIGTFIPNNHAHPFLGNLHQLEIVEEEKLEVVCSIQLAKKVISQLRKVHPYEEPAIDIIPLIDEDDLP